MGLKLHNYNETILIAMNYFGDKFNSINMLELGNQKIRGKTYPIDHPCRKFNTTKEYFKSLGINHISVDINGKNGALSLNLGVPFNKVEWLGYFDCVTNLGTLEHVDIDGLNGQYNAFKNVHDCTKVNGLIVHVLPLNLRGHCPYSYQEGIIEKLASFNEYILIHKNITPRGIDGALFRIVYKKNTDYNFMSFEDFIMMNEIKNIDGAK